MFVGVNNIQEYLKLRTAHVNSLKAAGDSPYPHKFVVTTSLTEFIEKYEHVNDGTQHPDVVSVAGDLLLLFMTIFVLVVDILVLQCFEFFSVLIRCWFGNREGMLPLKNMDHLFEMFISGRRGR